MCFFYGSLMNYWSFLYLVSALTPLKFQSAVLSLNPGGLYLFFFIFCFHFLFFFSPLDISFMLFTFSYSMATVTSSALKLSLLWHCAVYPCTLCTHPCCVFSLHVFLFLSQSAPATLYLLQWCFFFLQWFLFKSPLSSLPPPSHSLLLLSNHFTPLLLLPLPFPSPTLSLAASNMVYSLSCFPECEECCCFRMSPA